MEIWSRGLILTFRAYTTRTSNLITGLGCGASHSQQQKRLGESHAEGIELCLCAEKASGQMLIADQSNQWMSKLAIFAT